MAKQKPSLGSGVTFALVDIDKLAPDPRNVRKHGGRNLDAVVSSLKRFGQQKPVVATRHGIVIAGNATLEAARRLGWKQLAVMWSELDGKEAQAYAIADNRTAELATWDWDALKGQLEELAGTVDMAELAFDASDLALGSQQALEQLAQDAQLQEAAPDEQLSEELYDATTTELGENELPEHGSVWRIDSSVLIVCHPVRELGLWRGHLDASVEMVVPYPACAAPVSAATAKRRCLYLQPLRAAAGYMLRVARAASLEVEELE